MFYRTLEERFVMPNGIKGEWEPSSLTKFKLLEEGESRQVVVELNREAKNEGSFVRYRSVPIDD